MFRLEIIKKRFDFVFPAGTSRGVLHDKHSWFLKLTDNERPGVTGWGECSPVWGLSPENETGLEKKLTELSQRIEQFDFFLRTGLAEFPSIRFALETALIDFMHGGKQICFETPFTSGKTGIVINGLVWMNTPENALADARKKIESGFNCIKLKIGVYDWNEEEKIIQSLRNEFNADIEIRVDANGAFDFEQAKKVMERLAKYNVHSIEQPIKPGQIENIAKLSAEKSTPVALDEELIGKITPEQKNELLAAIKPSYIVIKPSLAGGFSATREWIDAAKKNNLAWWVTSMLETNLGLNAIAQYVATLNPVLPQGLGTGKIYSNNILSPLSVEKNKLYFNPTAAFSLNF
jgi:o-succinylbenzoate synthase